MKLFFIDDSGDIGKKSQGSLTRYYILGGLIIESEAWSPLKESLNKIKEYHNIDPDRQIKWTYVGSPSKNIDDNPLAKLSIGQKIDLAKEVLRLISRNIENKVLFQISDKETLYKLERIKKPRHIFNETYELLAEKFELFLAPESSMTTDVGVMIMENLTDNFRDERIKRIAVQLEKEGTIARELKHIIETVLYVPLENSTGIQLANFCMGAIARYLEHGDDKYINIIWKNIPIELGHPDSLTMERIISRMIGISPNKRIK